MKARSTAITARTLIAFCAVLGLDGCVSVPPAVPAVMVVPGPDKDLAAFQQDDQWCRQLAGAPAGNTGAQQPVPAAEAQGVPPPPAGPATVTGMPVVQEPNEIRYMQCMASRGDIVQPMPKAYPAYGYYPYVDLYGGFYGGWGWRGGWHRGWVHGGRGGFARGGGVRGGGGHR